MALFKKREVPSPPSAQLPSGIPVDQVIAMRKQGFSNNQIIQALQRDGYKSAQIFDALSQADLKMSMEQIPAEEYTRIAEPEKPMQFQYPAPQAAPMPTVPSVTEKEKVEEIAEAIIEEKWSELIANVEKIIAWKDRMESKITDIEQKFNELKSDFDRLRDGVIGKIGEYDKSISDVGSEIKALEKVFQKVLPTLTENVNELSRIASSLKSSKK